MKGKKEMEFKSISKIIGSKQKTIRYTLYIYHKFMKIDQVIQVRLISGRNQD